MNVFNFDDDPYGIWVGAAIVIACLLAGAFLGGAYAGEVGAVLGGLAGAFVGGGILYTIMRAFEAAIRNFVYVAPAVLIIGGAIWLYTRFS
ncbi:MAG: hypothetical protein AAF360_08600 [Pseudomonadota bacterium]